MAKGKSRRADARPAIREKSWEKRLLKLRVTLGLTGFGALAAKLGVKLDTLQRWVTGESKPERAVLRLIETLEAGAEEASHRDRVERIRSILGDDDPEEPDYWEYVCLWHKYLLAKAAKFYDLPQQLQGSVRDIWLLTATREQMGDELERFPLDRVAREARLDEDETAILAALVVAGVHVFQQPGRHEPSFEMRSGGFLLAVVCESRRDMARKARLFSEYARLSTSGLVEHQLRADTVPDSLYRLTDRAADDLLSDLPRELHSRLNPQDEREERKTHLARVVKPRVRLSDVILSRDVRRRLEEAMVFVRHGEKVFGEWGFGGCIHYGRGLGMLFSGPPGVGKTLSAEAFAGELGKDLWVASSAGVVSPWLGSTDKAIVRLFRSVREADAVLLLDEADGFFASREMAAHNWQLRHLNTLLQEIEQHEGVVILATNFRQVLDHALERRLFAVLEFPPPGREERQLLWRRHLPEKAPLAGDVSIERLAELELTGGEIKKAVLSAAASALSRDPEAAVITHADLETAARESVKPAPRIGFDGRNGTHARGARRSGQTQLSGTLHEKGVLPCVTPRSVPGCHSSVQAPSSTRQMATISPSRWKPTSRTTGSSV